MHAEEYVHGYSEREAERLHDQAGGLAELLHADTGYPPGSTILEAGCGVGAQTRILAEKSPGAKITSIDISRESLAKAKDLVARSGCDNVVFHLADIFNPPFADNAFDHVFVCFVLEHLMDPAAALKSLKRVLKSGGTMTVIEGDHGSCYFHPESPEALKVWQCLIDSQAALGGNSLIGRRVCPLLIQAGFRGVSVSPRMVYCDEKRPHMVDAFVKKIIIPMVEGVKDRALGLGMTDRRTWDLGIQGLHRTARAGGTFCYTFFKGLGYK